MECAGSSTSAPSLCCSVFGELCRSQYADSLAISNLIKEFILHTLYDHQRASLARRLGKRWLSKRGSLPGLAIQSHQVAVWACCKLEVGAPGFSRLWMRVGAPNTRVSLFFLLVSSSFINISLLQLCTRCCFIFFLRSDNTKFKTLEQNKTD